MKYSYAKGQVAKAPDETKTLMDLVIEAVELETITAQLYSDLSSTFAYMDYNGFKRKMRYAGMKEFKENFCWRAFLVDVLDVKPEIEVEYESPTGLMTVQDIINCKHTWLQEKEMYFDRILKLSMESTDMKAPLIYDFACHMLKMNRHNIMKTERLYKMFDRTQWNAHEMNVVDRATHKMYKCKEARSYGWKDY